MEIKPHYFWALRLPDETKQMMHSEINKIKNSFPFKRWVHFKDYHITFAFLGAAKEKELITSIELVKEALQDIKPFPLFIKGIDIFGNKVSPRIFWVSMHEEKQLHDLQSYIYTSCVEAGFTLDKKPFNPHITIARNWNGTHFELNWLEENNPFKNEMLSFLANDIVLYKSNIEKSPKYEPIATFSL